MANPVTSYDLRADLRSAQKYNDRTSFRDLQRGEKVALPFTIGDETTAITAAANKLKVRAPFKFKLTEVRASATTAPTGAALLVDVNVDGTSVLGTAKLRIDVSEKTSTTASAATSITTPTIPDDAEISFDFDQVGSTVAGAGIKVWLIGTRL